ncbi:MAG: EF-hand domain-containing protein [Phycisphaerae bacterium]|nr:EF-hand domain-containing protein [Phycisphaerae bacterium]
MRKIIGVAAGIGAACLACVALAQGPEGKPGDGPDQGWQGRRGGHHPGRGHFRPPVPPLMVALDADKDGELSAEEIANAAAALKALDTDGDGKLSREEIRPKFVGQGPQAGFGGPGRGRGPAPGGEGFVERIMSHDKDGDGKVTKDELPGRAQRLIERGDTNGDGAIDKEEAQKMAEEFAQRRGGPGQGPGQGCRPKDSSQGQQRGPMRLGEQ